MHALSRNLSRIMVTCNIVNGTPKCPSSMASFTATHKRRYPVSCDEENDEEKADNVAEIEKATVFLTRIQKSEKCTAIFCV